MLLLWRLNDVDSFQLSPEEVPVILSSKLAAGYNQKPIEAMREVAKAASDRSLGAFLNVSLNISIDT